MNNDLNNNRPSNDPLLNETSEVVMNDPLQNEQSTNEYKETKEAEEIIVCDPMAFAIGYA